MLAILRLISVLAGNSLQRAGLRVARVSGLLAVALLFVMLGLTGFAVAVFILLARVMDPALAALMLGLFCLLIAAILLLVARTQASRTRTPHGTADQPLAQPDLTALLQTAGKTGIWLPLGLAALAAFILTSRRR